MLAGSSAYAGGAVASPFSAGACGADATPTAAATTTQVYVPIDGALEPASPPFPEGAYPSRTVLRCWWDHHPFDHPPVGIIVAYNPHMVLHVVSTQGNRVHTVPEGLTQSEAAHLHGRPDVISTDDYPSEGVFCSYECAYAYTRAFYKPDYKDFTMLYQHRWRDLHNGEDPPRLVPAPPYVLLQAYGGHMTIEEYRAQLGVLRVEDAMSVHNPAGYLARTQRVYSIHHVWPQNHAIRQRALGLASSAPNGPVTWQNQHQHQQAKVKLEQQELEAAAGQAGQQWGTTLKEIAAGDDVSHQALPPNQIEARGATFCVGVDADDCGHQQQPVIEPPPARPRAPRARPEKRKRAPNPNPKTTATKRAAAARQAEAPSQPADLAEADATQPQPSCPPPLDGGGIADGTNDA